MDLSSYDITNKTEKENEIINANKNYNEGLINKLSQYNIDYLYLDSKGNITKDGQIIKEIPFKLNLINEFKNKIRHLRIEKSDLEEQWKNFVQQLFPQKHIEILYYNPLKSLKLKQNRILFHLFEDHNNNYYEMVQMDKSHYYNINNDEIDKDMIDRIERNNIKNWKMNIFFKMTDN